MQVLKMLPVLALVLGGWLCLTAPAGHAEEPEFTYGTVVSTTDKTVTISEYDFDLDDEVEHTYVLTAESEFENFSSLGELQPGEEIDIFYTLSGEDRFITSIARNSADMENMDEDEQFAPIESNP